MKRHVPALVSGLGGVIWLGALGYFVALNPTALEWLTVGDWGQHVTGWLFFRDDAWRFPFGAVHTLAHPMGTNIAFTDSMPWVAMFFKAFSWALPRPFQYVGLWLFTCFFLQGFVGAKLMRLFDTRAWVQCGGGTLFVLAPPLVFRLGHDALCTTATLLFGLWVYFKPVVNRGDVLRGFAFTVGLVAFCAGIHPTLAAMVLGLSAAALVKWWWAAGKLSLAALALGLGGQAGVLLLCFFLIGALGWGARNAAGGFGIYSADLATFFNPMGFSRFFPALPLGHFEQYEGFAYLGVGGIALLILALALLVRHPAALSAKHVRAVIPVAGVAVAMAVFALSEQITALGQTVATARGFYSHFAFITGSFRSSGRFIWPLYYLLLTLSLAVTVKLLARTPRTLAAVLTALVCVQWLELDTTAPRSRLIPRGITARPPPTWEIARGDYTHVVLVPPYVVGSDLGCGGDYGEDAYLPFALVAAQLGMTINSIALARLDVAALHRHCEAQRTLPTEPAPDVIYVLGPHQPLPAPGAPFTCGQVDNQRLCVSREHATRFHTALEASPIQEL